MQTLEQVRLKIKRWQSRATRANNALTKLYRQEARMVKAMHMPELPKQPKPAAIVPEPKPVVSDVSEISWAEMTGENLRLPEFLDRGNPVIAEEMTKVRKAAEVEARKAMPLSGKAAAALIKRKTKARVSATLTR